MRSALGILVLVMVAAAAPASAHHSFAVYFDDQTIIEVTGSVTDFRFTNPHANVSSKWLLDELKQWGWEGGGKLYRKPTPKRERYWLVPRLDRARQLFAQRLGANPFVD